jgi:hypothetical protein
MIVRPASAWRATGAAVCASRVGAVAQTIAQTSAGNTLIKLNRGTGPDYTDYTRVASEGRLTRRDGTSEGSSARRRGK